MQFENVLKCHRSLFHLITEEHLLQCDCISLTDENNVEQKIYLAKAANGFEVRIYKAHAEDTFVPSILDFEIKKYESNNEFASFFFDRFFFAHRFIAILQKTHPEYDERPI